MNWLSSTASALASMLNNLSYTTGRTSAIHRWRPPWRRCCSASSAPAVTARAIGKLATADQDQAPPRRGTVRGRPAHRGEILGDYEILRENRPRRNGHRHLARQNSLGRTVALKMLPADLAGNDAALTRFKPRDAPGWRAAIIPTSSRSWPGGTMPRWPLFYTMEYVPGCDLEPGVARAVGHRPPNAPLCAGLGGHSAAHAVVSASRVKCRRDRLIRRRPRRFAWMGISTPTRGRSSR